MKNILLFAFLISFIACQETTRQPINQPDGISKDISSIQKEMVSLPYPDSLFETFEMEDGEVVYVMKKYYIAFLKEGPKRDQSEAEAAAIQKAHLAHLSQLALEKRICMVGPFGQDADSDIQGIVIFSVPNKEEAERLIAQDPAVQAGRLIIEVQPWWAAKGSELF